MYNHNQYTKETKQVPQWLCITFLVVLLVLPLVGINPLLWVVSTLTLSVVYQAGFCITNLFNQLTK